VSGFFFAHQAARSYWTAVPNLGTNIPKMGIKKRSLGLAGALFSHVQLRVLSLFFGQPDRSYQLTELIELAGSGRGAVQREVEKLAEAGILKLTVARKRKVYQANRQSPIFKELYGLILKTAGLIEPLRSALEPYRRKLELAFVYGSVARGIDTARSDIDLMIIGQDIAYSEIYAALQKAEKTLLRPVNPNLMTLREWQEKNAAQNSFVRNVIRQPKLFVFGTQNELKGIG
jgi:predicted nucleotidyltransferase